MSELTEWKRAGKDTIRVGSHVKVDGSELERGWTAKLLELRKRAGREPLAIVTAPRNLAGVRHISAERCSNRRS